jgi:hypothetical protein
MDNKHFGKCSKEWKNENSNDLFKSDRICLFESQSFHKGVIWKAKSLFFINAKHCDYPQY